MAHARAHTSIRNQCAYSIALMMQNHLLSTTLTPPYAPMPQAPPPRTTSYVTAATTESSPSRSMDGSIYQAAKNATAKARASRSGATTTSTPTPTSSSSFSSSSSSSSTAQQDHDEQLPLPPSPRYAAPYTLYRSRRTLHRASCTLPFESNVRGIVKRHHLLLFFAFFFFCVNSENTKVRILLPLLWAVEQSGWPGCDVVVVCVCVCACQWQDGGYGRA